MIIKQNLIRILTPIIVSLLVGCASTPEPANTGAIEINPIIQPEKIIAKKSNTSNMVWNIEALNKQFQEWDAVKYRYGGLSKEGIDCSGFVYLTFLHQFGIELPRNSSSQVKLGATIAKNDLKTGDLVFFKTGFTNHVGIYLNNHKFIHSSTTEGVTTSSLDSKYWTRTYWTAKRLDLKVLKQSKTS